MKFLEEWFSNFIKKHLVVTYEDYKGKRWMPKFMKKMKSKLFRKMQKAYVIYVIHLNMHKFLKQILECLFKRKESIFA